MDSIQPWQVVLEIEGERAARRYFLTAEMITALALKEMGLAHEVVPGVRLDETCQRITDALQRGAPQAQAAAKALIRDLAKSAAGGRGVSQHVGG